MRKLNRAVLFSFSLFVFVSCKKDIGIDNSPSTPDETINVRIAANQSYSLDLGNTINVSITRQASHFLLSETLINNETGNRIYNYIPSDGFAGNDEVVLLAAPASTNSVSENNSGCPSRNESAPSTSIKYISLKITVGN